MSINEQTSIQDKIELSPQYIAGFFDADGSNSGWHGELICRLLKEKFAGCITYMSSKSKKESHRKVFWFRLNGRKVVSDFLLHIKDYLIIKKEQAELCLEFINKLNTYQKQKTVSQIEEFENYVARCKEMKRKC